MNIRNVFINLHPAAQLLIVITVSFIGLLVSQALSLITFFIIPKDLVSNNFLITDMNIGVIKFIQVINSILVFIIPAYIIAYISTPDPLNYLKLRAKHNFSNYFMVGIIAVSSIAVINVLAKWNSNLNLPDSMDSLENVIQKMEESAGNMQERMLNVNTIFGLLINIFVIAIIPAVSEEFLFRGVIQRLLRDWIKNIHVAIIITGIIFSVVHFQFYGFVPRMFLGILFGYLLYWTNNLWVPIAAHFLNNAIAVISYYIYYNSDNKVETLNPDEIGLQPNSIFLYLSIAGLLLACFYFIKRKRETTL